MEPAFRASVLIDDRGISIPLPPPSLHAEPTQEVEVEGEVVGLDELGQEFVVRLVDTVGGAEIDVTLPPGTSTFVAEGLQIDLTSNCIEVWLVDDEGDEGEHRSFQASIAESGSEVTATEVDSCDDL
ncbi:MAG: hypothetical protein AAF799_45415 [Myxococcota bacterium]